MVKKEPKNVAKHDTVDESGWCKFQKLSTELCGIQGKLDSVLKDQRDILKRIDNMGSKQTQIINSLANLENQFNPKEPLNRRKGIIKEWCICSTGFIQGIFCLLVALAAIIICSQLIFPFPIFRDCDEIKLKNRNALSKDYLIQPHDGRPEFTVYCDMQRKAGGWTVIQRREDRSVDFYRNWAEYKDGFGNVNSNFWLGNEQINRITSDGSFELLIEMTDHLNVMKIARYSHFHIDDEESNYVLTISGYTGTAGDSLASHNGQQFSTKDRDNDKNSANCAEACKGGWWYNNCASSNLNGLYLTPGTDDSKGISWYHFYNNNNSLKKTVMMVKRAP
ncbi:fibrinogen-like protein A [Antedon mediterranea]|uniref:fibrinogen-like protein A n=1 Tax=Antedon mediterranea TaxID=105859 RepID=UPI003AF5B28C